MFQGSVSINNKKYKSYYDDIKNYPRIIITSKLLLYIITDHPIIFGLHMKRQMTKMSKCGAKIATWWLYLETIRLGITDASIYSLKRKFKCFNLSLP